MKGRKYGSPPVVEALCEIYFTRSEWDDTVPGRFYDLVRDSYPVKQQKDIQEAEVRFSPSGRATAGVRNLAPWMQFKTEEGDRMIQLAADLLVVNQLLPYPGFGAWQPAIASALDVYRKAANPQGIARLGIRYINKVVIPEPKILMEDYFTIYPNLPRDLGEVHGSFMVRVELPVEASAHSVLLTFASAPTQAPQTVAHLLDIYDRLRPDASIAWEAIAREVRQAHDNVERAFEGSITDRLRARFD